MHFWAYFLSTTDLKNTKVLNGPFYKKELYYYMLIPSIAISHSTPVKHLSGDIIHACEILRCEHNVEQPKNMTGGKGLVLN